MELINFLIEHYFLSLPLLAIILLLINASSKKGGKKITPQSFALEGAVWCVRPVGKTRRLGGAREGGRGSGLDKTPTLPRRLVNCPFSVLERAPRPPFYGLEPARFGPEVVFTKPRFTKGGFVHPPKRWSAVGISWLLAAWLRASVVN